MGIMAGKSKLTCCCCRYQVSHPGDFLHWLMLQISASYRELAISGTSFCVYPPTMAANNSLWFWNLLDNNAAAMYDRFANYGAVHFSEFCFLHHCQTLKEVMLYHSSKYVCWGWGPCALMVWAELLGHLSRGGWVKKVFKPFSDPSNATCVPEITFSGARAVDGFSPIVRKGSNLAITIAGSIRLEGLGSNDLRTRALAAPPTIGLCQQEPASSAGLHHSGSEHASPPSSVPVLHGLSVPKQW